jgi:microsomal dipeptidase-like Zn-dependent dipeptidase
MRRGRECGKLTGRAYRDRTARAPSGCSGRASGNLDTGEVAEFEPVEYGEGLENPSEFPNVVRWLVAHGYPDEQIAKVVGGNVVRALREVWV